MDIAHHNIHIHRIFELGGRKSIPNQRALTPLWETRVAQR